MKVRLEFTSHADSLALYVTRRNLDRLPLTIVTCDGDGIDVECDRNRLSLDRIRWAAKVAGVSAIAFDVKARSQDICAIVAPTP